ncbi:hypothetical protein [Verminephrobacter eiseniae]|uniref:hypothetical protein n=1 Tax=Verminephrobacter eiseniae TaxID=364317 RepID=UPI0005A553C2|nr:hypothetical protein [Verminephrobacter eiseniae]MCW5285596.1 hypothetical protein [Verminephrobacter eiseniae]MCW5303896.1 hypothetical protein [Verminephrobacter eiseniae]MCW8181825.1 hypothetical protein [Verminephrobacter eiseniae]MCW8192078.1 hypothetical protein [Verminephrobacter eiseniae]
MSIDAALAATVRHLGAMSLIRLLKFASGWTITLSGVFIMMIDAGALTVQWLRRVFSAISGAMP